jgi:hypothetical protein
MSQVLNGWETTLKSTDPCDVTTSDVPASSKCGLDVVIVGGGVAAPGGGGVSSGITTDVTVSEFAWTALPVVSAVGRAGVTVQNQTVFNIKINFATPAGYVGVLVAAGGERFYDANDTAVIYAKAEPGAGGALSGILVEELIP